MVSKIELHLRSSAIGQHRCFGTVSVEHHGPRLAPHEDIEYWCAGRRIRACITSIHQRGDRLPCIYADEVAADELVG
jgi:hypothetical protein